MTFNSRDDFKAACKRYGLATYRHIKFDKDHDQPANGAAMQPSPRGVAGSKLLH